MQSQQDKLSSEIGLRVLSVSQETNYFQVTNKEGVGNSFVCMKLEGKFYSFEYNFIWIAICF